MMGTIGALTILCLTFYVGFLFSRMQNGRQKRLECFLQLIRFIESEISCYQTPLDDIYRRFDGDALEKCGFTAVLRQKGMAAALAECRAALCFSDEEYRLLVDFSGELGKSYREEQLRGCEYYRRMLDSYCNEGRQALPARLKLCRSLTVTGGLLLVVLLI
jgi:stage III sporulation protein AB